MGEVLVLVEKFGIKALPLILAEWGPLTTFIAFFVLVPLGHLSVGIALLLCGAFVPKLPGDDTKHVINIGSSDHKIALNGNARTALMAGGLVIILGAIIEFSRGSAVS